MWRILLVILIGSSGAVADDLDARARELDKLLMSPCCWTQTLNNHHSKIAQQMRAEIRQMLKDGKTDEDILTRFTAEYGKRIMAMPSAQGFDLAAYALPAMFLVSGGGVIWLILRSWGFSSQIDPARKELLQVDRTYAERLNRELLEDV